MTPITPAKLAWQGNQPRSLDFDDIYFSEDGIAEAQRVFIQPSGILDKATSQPEICVAELGFGTGLNFATLAQHVLTHSQARLRFVSFEKHPLTYPDWQRVVAARSATLPIYTELLEQPLSLIPGWQQRVMANGRIVLSVFHGDVAQGLEDLAQRQKNPVDAWFLDGFAPDKNPAMWSSNLYQHMAAASAPQTTLATFSAAGHVRRGLEAVGFDMRKVGQQPYKRESLAGHFQGKGKNRSIQAPKRVNIFGAGLGGACMARYLADHDINVVVYDPNGVARSASSIDAAIMHSRLLSDGSADAELRVASFHFAANYLKRFGGFKQTGVLQVQGPNLNQAKLDKLCRVYDAHDPSQHDWLQRLEPKAATALSGFELETPALYFPTAGIVDGPTLCKALMDHPRIEHFAASPTLDRREVNIICAAGGTRAFPGCAHLEITEVWGQLDWYDTPHSTGSIPLVGNGYLVPTDQACVFGATYEYEAWPSQDATKHNKKLNAHYFNDSCMTWQRAVRGPRAVTSDRIPVVGQLNEEQDSMWLATAFGSMGTTAAPYAAAIVASEILGWLSPVQPSVRHLVRPARFAERQARRGVRHI